MRLLITGKGYIGTNLFESLNNQSDKFQPRLISKQELDYTDDRELAKELVTGDYDHVINTCGYTGRPNVDACEDNRQDTWHYNVVVPTRIQRTCEEHHVPFIHVSSGCIFDGYDREYTETDTPDFGLSNPTSSWYSKTKHACELMLSDTPTNILRIRMPFCQTTSERNIISKLRKYDNVINMKNSLTSVEDLGTFIKKLVTNELSSGVWNVVNPQPVNTKQITDLMKEHGIGNPAWSFISYEELRETTKTGRSNCVLSDEKISNHDMKLPDTMVSLRRSMERISDKLRKRDLEAAV